jgi:hypothetical protein
MKAIPWMPLFLFPLRPLRPCGTLLSFTSSPGPTGRWCTTGAARPRHTARALVGHY